MSGVARACRARARAAARHPPPFFLSLSSQAAAAAALAFSPLAASAGEFDLLSAPTPTKSYVIDDASVLNKTTRKSLNDTLARLELETGYRLEVATVRKLEVEGDPFALGDKMVEHWYPTRAQGDTKGVLLLVTATKDGALTGGPAFVKAVGDELIDSVVGDNLPLLAGDEKFNEAVASSVKRVEAKLTGAWEGGGARGEEEAREVRALNPPLPPSPPPPPGKPDPGPPARKDETRRRTYKTKAETDKTRNVTGTIVLSLLAISVVVPMLQYYGYTSTDE